MQRPLRFPTNHAAHTAAEHRFAIHSFRGGPTIRAGDVTPGWYQLASDRSFFKVEFVSRHVNAPGYLVFRLLTELRPGRAMRYAVTFAENDQLAWTRDEDEVMI